MVQVENRATRHLNFPLNREKRCVERKLNQMGGVKPRVTMLPGGVFAKTRPIQHGYGDNTELIENLAQAIHTRYTNIQGPRNMPYGANYRPSAPSDNGAAFNGGSVTAPPQSSGG